MQILHGFSRFLRFLTLKHRNVIVQQSGCGGMVDALASGASEGNFVGVQIPSAAYIT